MIRSEITPVGAVRFPEVTGTRWMMMPFRLEDPETVPPHYREFVRQMLQYNCPHEGVGYLTVDETVLKAGETQRRPGLHVDGGPRSGWGGGGGGWASQGMLLVNSDGACRGWDQTFEGEIGEDGNCDHLRPQCSEDHEVQMRPEIIYWCSPLAVHEALPSQEGPRQFARLSMPSDAPWYEGYTESPYGVLPGGPVLPRRSSQMGWRA